MSEDVQLELFKEICTTALDKKLTTYTKLLNQFSDEKHPYILNQKHLYIMENKEFFLEYLKEIKECEEKENIIKLLKLIDNECIVSYKGLVDFITDAMFTEPDDPDIEESSEDYELMLHTVINKQAFFKEYLF